MYILFNSFLQRWHTLCDITVRKSRKTPKTNLIERRVRPMKTVILSGVLILLSITGAWAGDETPTVLSNKEALDLVQSHADYVWTRSLQPWSFSCKPVLPWLRADLPAPVRCSAAAGTGAAHLFRRNSTPPWPELSQMLGQF